MGHSIVMTVNSMPLDIKLMWYWCGLYQSCHAGRLRCTLWTAPTSSMRWQISLYQSLGSMIDLLGLATTAQLEVLHHGRIRDLSWWSSIIYLQYSPRGICKKIQLLNITALLGHKIKAIHSNHDAVSTRAATGSPAIDRLLLILVISGSGSNFVA